MQNPGKPGPIRADVVNGILDVIRDEWEDEIGRYRVTVERQHEEIKTLMRILAKYGVEPDPPLRKAA